MNKVTAGRDALGDFAPPQVVANADIIDTMHTPADKSLAKVRFR
jgi:hypothetical protein